MKSKKSVILKELEAIKSLDELLITLDIAYAKSRHISGWNYFLEGELTKEESDVILDWANDHDCRFVTQRAEDEDGDVEWSLLVHYNLAQTSKIKLEIPDFLLSDIDSFCEDLDYTREDLILSMILNGLRDIKDQLDELDEEEMDDDLKELSEPQSKDKDKFKLN